MTAGTPATALDDWLALAAMVQEANALGAEFRVQGDRIEVYGLDALPASVRDALQRHHRLLWHFLGAHRTNAEAARFFDDLGVSLVVATNQKQAEQSLAALASDAAAHNNTAALDIETCPRAPYAVPRPAIHIKKDGTPGAVQPKPADRVGLDPHRAAIATLQLYAGGKSIYVFHGEALDAVLASPFLRTTDLAIHNACFELAFLRVWATQHPTPATNLPRGRIECTLQATGLIKGVGFAGEGRSLEEAALHFLGKTPPKALQVSDWGAPALSRGQHCYAASDAVLTHRLWTILKGDLQRSGRWEAYELQRRAISAVVDMEMRGFLLDQEEHWRQSEDWTNELAEAREAYRKETGAPPPETPKHLQQWLRDNLPAHDLARWPMTENANELSTQTRHLRRLIALPGARAILRVIAHNKLLASFGPKLIEHINPATGRIHPRFNIAASKSGRFSCSRPNLQQIPSKKAPRFRRCIVATPGYILVGADWSQVEMRAMAWISQDTELTRIFEEGRDIHEETAAAIAGVPIEQVTKEQRQAAKAINFGSIYGIGPASLAQSAFDNYDVEMSEQEARDALDKFFRRFPQLARYLRIHAEECQQRGSVVIGAGRVVEAAWEPYGNLSYPQCCNLPVQGIAADCMLRAVSMVHSQLQRANMDGGLLATVHDELLLEVIEQDAEQAREILHRCMVRAFEITFPGAPTTNVATAFIGHSWADLKEGAPGGAAPAKTENNEITAAASCTHPRSGPGSVLIQRQSEDPAPANFATANDGTMRPPTQTVIEGDCVAKMRTMAADSVAVVVTSPPYNIGARYSLYDDSQHLDAYLALQHQAASEVARVLRPGGHVFLVVGSNSRFPWRSVEVAQAWATALTLQQQIVWAKSIALDAQSLPDPVMRAEMHERTFGHFVSLTSERFLNPCHESVWHFTHNGRAEIDRPAIGVRYTYDDQPARFGHHRRVHCRGNLWHVPTPTVQNNSERFDHPASFPPALAELAIKLSGAAGNDVVLDPFAGIGSTLLAAQRLGLNAIGIELDPLYCAATRRRLGQDGEG